MSDPASRGDAVDVPVIPHGHTGSSRAVFAVTLLAVALFVPALQYGFVWDDVPLIQNNQFLQNDDSLATFLRRDFTELTFGSFGGGFFRPLFALTLWTDAAVWGLHPRGFHLTNLLLHGSVVALLWLMTRRLSDASTATLTSALFAVHPAHSEVAVFISGRVDSLPLIPMLGGLWLFWELGRSRGFWRKGILHAGIVAAAVLALAAKESAVVLPGLLLILGLANTAGNDGTWPDRLRKTLTNASGVLIVVGFYAASRFAMVTRYFAHASGNTDVASRMWVAVEAFGYYTLQALLPFPLGPERYPAIPDAPWTLLGVSGWTSAIIVACWLWWAWDRRPLAAVGLLWFLLALAPILVALPVTKAGEYVLAERWLYAASAGMMLAVAATVHPWLTGPGNPVPVRFARGIMLTWGAVALGALLWITPVWASNATFHRYILARNPEAPGPLTNVAILEIEAGRPEVATQLLQRAAARSPADPKIWLNLGLALRQLKRYDEALVAFQKSLDLNPNWVVPATFMGSVYYDTGRYEDGIALMQPVVRRAPRYAYGHFFLGVFYESAGRLDDAVTAYRETIRLSPMHITAVRNLARIQARMGSFDAAAATLEEGMVASPSAPWLQMDLAALYERTGRREKARALWGAVAAQSSDPELAKAATAKLAH